MWEESQGEEFGIVLPTLYTIIRTTDNLKWNGNIATPSSHATNFKKSRAWGGVKRGGAWAELVRGTDNIFYNNFLSFFPLHFLFYHRHVIT